MTGFEPAASGTTIQRSTLELHPPHIVVVIDILERAVFYQKGRKLARRDGLVDQNSMRMVRVIHCLSSLWGT